MSIETSRLILKEISPTLIRNLFSTKSKQEIIDFFNCDEEHFYRYKEMYEKGMETFKISMKYFLVVNKETNLGMGECGFHTWNAIHRRAEIFYYLYNDEFKQKGYISEALPIVLKYGFEEMSLHRIEALIDENNIPSKRLLEKNNFTREGIVREDYVVDGKNEDSVCYSLLYWEYLDEKSPRYI